MGPLGAMLTQVEGFEGGDELRPGCGFQGRGDEPDNGDRIHGRVLRVLDSGVSNPLVLG